MPDVVVTTERGLPWAGVSQAVDGPMTAAQALAAADLDWSVEKVPAFVQGEGRRYEQIPNRFGMVRQDTRQVFPVAVGSDYAPFQNRDAFAFADNLVDAGDARYVGAGSFRGGRTVFLQMALDGFNVAGEDAHDLFLLLVNSHDGLKAVTCLPTAIRVRCQNTMNMALRGAQRRWSARHVSTIAGRIHEAREAMELTAAYSGALQAELEGLYSQQFTERRLRTALERVIPETPRAERARDHIVGLFNDSETLEGLRLTKLGALNAVGEYYDWARSPRTEESRLIGALPGGVGARTRDRMLEALAA